MKKQLAIKGHEYRGKEVIEILEMLGGKKTIYCGSDTLHIYSLDDSGKIITQLYQDSFLTSLTYDVYTLEEFLEKFPFKINDVVINSDYRGRGIITEMVWDCNNHGVKYCVKFEDFGTIAWFNSHEIKFANTSRKDDRNVNDICDNILINQISAKVAIINLKSDVCDDEVELNLGDYEIEVRDGKTYAVKKKPKYPTTYEECCGILGMTFDYPDIRMVSIDEYNLYSNFIQLIRCRDAYWKIAGEEMGLGEPWKQDYDDRCLIIANNNGNIHTYEYHGNNNIILAFPTMEMRNTFYENFKDLINDCKEFL